MKYLLYSTLIWLAACGLPPAPGKIIFIQQDSGSTASLRGLAVVDSVTAWASGSKGTVLRTVNGGLTWENVSLPHADTVDFRDIEAFSADEAIIISAGFPGLIFKTIDGGKEWQLVHKDDREQIFFDAMDFWDHKSGIAFGDAIDGRIVIITTNDYGQTWQALPKELCPEALPGEGGFAASGTCLTTFGDSEVWIALGTPQSRVVYSPDRGETWTAVSTPMAQDAPGAGIFSLDFSSPKYGIAVGGNYELPNDSTKIIAITEDGGKTWQLIRKSGINGYKSAITRIPNSRKWLCAGPTGVNFSSDNGLTWTLADTTGYHTVVMTDKHTGWLSGANGRIARIKISQ